QSSLLLTADFVDRHTNGHPAPISVEFRLKLPQALWPHFERIANRYIRYGKDFVEEVWDTVRPSKDPDVTCPVYMIAAEANGRTHGILVPYPNHVQKIDS
ncbi:MAG TPA: hypothetical protein VLF59_02545, partial [Candidatus Saccharimonadales bacterium]|nr:hypothetical protein [Candidatus Saccharimonadales bacterium]